jgi:hypothetical protein
MAVYHALVAAGLWHDALNWGVGAVLGFMLARVPWKRHQKKTAAQQAELMDRLNADTPGGLGEIADLLRQDGFSQLAALLTDQTRKDPE